MKELKMWRSPLNIMTWLSGFKFDFLLTLLLNFFSVAFHRCPSGLRHRIFCHVLTLLDPGDNSSSLCGLQKKRRQQVSN